MVVAHPDDETIGIGGQLARLDGVVIVHLTNGAPQDLSGAHMYGFPTRAAYATARRVELERALSAGGAARVSTVAFDIDDQALTLHLAEAARRLAALFAERGIAAALTHPYEGGHPDHDAAAFVVRAASRLLARERERPVEIGEMTSYHAGDDGVVTQRFSDVPPVPEIAISLGEAAWHRKQLMLGAFVTQGDLLSSFNARIERLRAAPGYDFTRPPNGGRIHYQSFVGWRPEQWCRLAAAALADLDQAPPQI